MLDTGRRQEIVKEYQQKPGDTGSSEVQVALLTERITYLTTHMKAHKKDHHSRRGLELLVSQRKALLGYLKRNDPSRHASLIKRLGIRK